MLKDFFSIKKIGGFIDKVRVGGFTVKEMLKKNKQNTVFALKELTERAVRSEMEAETYIQELGKTFKSRRRKLLTNLKNIMSSVRGKARDIQSFGKKGKWYNVGVFDSNQTEICASYMGESWDIPYEQIPDKPPRISVTYHPCRSILEFIESGEPPIDQAPFKTQFGNASDEVKEGLLGKTKFKAFQSGEFEINSFADYEKIRRWTLDELGL